MKQTMIQRFKDYKKWKELIDYNSFEVKASVVTVLLLLLFLIYLDVYGEFSHYVEAIRNFLIYVATAEIGMLGLILAGISIFISILNKEFLKNLVKVSPDKSVLKEAQGILVSFEFIGFLITVSTIINYSIYFLVYSQQALVSEIWFFIIVVLILYKISFILWYLLSIIGNSVRLYYISSVFVHIEDIESKRNELIMIVNEVKLSYLLEKLKEGNNSDNFQVSKNELLLYIVSKKIKRKDEILDYVNNDEDLLSIDKK